MPISTCSSQAIKLLPTTPYIQTYTHNSFCFQKYPFSSFYKKIKKIKSFDILYFFSFFFLKKCLTSNYPNFVLKSYDDSIKFLKWSFAPYKSLIREVLTLIGIPKDRTRLQYPNLKFTLKNIQNKKYIKFSKLKNIKHFNN